VPSLIGVEVRKHAQAVLDIMPRLRANTWWSSDRSLHVLLTKFAKSKSGDPRDKIYALLGISEDANEPARFYPSYEKRVNTVFNHTLRFLLFGDILNSGLAFPPVTFEELGGPISRSAMKTLEWNLNRPRKLCSSVSQHRAMILIDRINEGQIELADRLSDLAEKNHQIFPRLDSPLLTKDGHTHLNLTFEEDKAILTISSDQGTQTPTSLFFPRGKLDPSEYRRRVDQKCEGQLSRPRLLDG
jgi:hypothetical protein